MSSSIENLNFLQDLKKEESLISKTRSAVKFCLNSTGVTATDVSKVTPEDKVNVENCLRENFLSKNPDYFGKRQTIFLDLY